MSFPCRWRQRDNQATWALVMAALMNVLGGLVSTKVAATVGGGIIGPPQGTHGLVIVFAALIGAITTRLLVAGSSFFTA